MLITSLGIFGYLSKAHSEQTGDTAQAQSVVTRIDNLIAREENKIETYEGRISTLGVATIDVSDSIAQQEIIRDGAWDRVQGDIDYAQGQIESLRGQITTLDSAVNSLRDKGVEVITTDEGGVFQGAETETIDYVAQANTLFEQQKEQREQIRADIKVQTDNIDRYRRQAQETIDGANAEIKRLQQASTGDADEIIAKTDEYNLLIDETYDTIDELKLEKFDSEQIILTLEREVGPIKYIAEVIYGQEDSVKYLDNAVRWVIYMLIFVFDPLAVLLLISSIGQVYREEEKTRPNITEKRYVLQVPKSRLRNMDNINKPINPQN
jgi:chromosome segregation ATPase